MVTVKSKKGKDITLLNPKEKGEKFATELRTGLSITNDGTVKYDENDNHKVLTNEQRSFRSGYLAARKDSANCHKAMLKKEGKVYVPKDKSFKTSQK